MRLRELRKQRKLTQAQIALFLDIPLRTYQNYERNVNEPNSDILCRLADLYDVTVDYVLGHSSIMRPYDGDRLAEDERDLVDAYRSMDDGLRAALLAIARGLAE